MKTSMIYIVLFVFGSLLFVPGLMLKDKPEILEKNINVELNLGPTPLSSSRKSLNHKESFEQSSEMELEDWMMDPDSWSPDSRSDTLSDDV